MYENIPQYGTKTKANKTLKICMPFDIAIKFQEYRRQ